MNHSNLTRDVMGQLPDEIAQLFTMEPSWLSLSSPLRQSIDRNTSIVFRQPNFSSWIQMEDV